MRRLLLLLALLVPLPGCRRGTPPPDPGAEARETAKATPTPAPSASPAPPPAAPPTPAAPPPAAAPASAAAEPAPPAPPGSGTTAAAPAAQPAAAAAPATAAAQPGPDEEDDRLYSWTDEHGTIHYSSGTDIPDDRRRSARAVGGGVTVMPAPPPPVSARSTAAEEHPTAPKEAAPKEPTKGPQPQLDEKGLPIPGTMDDTSHTRTVKQAGSQLDPAAVERRYKEQLRDMNCREQNGVVTCG